MSVERDPPLRLPSPAEVERRLAERSQSVDRLVRTAFDEHLAPVFPSGLAALAVGGFGRRELFPHSDVDVLLLTREGLRNSAIKEPAGNFLRSLWDAGLRIGHSVHTVDECCQVYEHNVELSISLLDRRPLAGDPALLAEFDAEMPRFYRMHGKSLMRHLARLTRFRHAKFQNTIYHLEPNVKETPGALRDLQAVRWFEQLRHGAPANRAEAGEGWRLLTPLRYFVHNRAKRDDNLLSFEVQDEISNDPAGMMRAYYRSARDVFGQVMGLIEAAEDLQPSMVRQLRDWRSRLSNSEFTVSRDRVFVRSPQLLPVDPDLVARLFEFSARHGLPLSGEAQRRIAEASGAIAARTLDQPLWPNLKAILSAPKASVAVRQMHNTGLLGALIPEWRHIDCLVVRDFYHRYTVDEHTIVALETLETLADERFRELAEEVEEMALLRIALLLHDIGKGTGREHTAESARLAAKIGARAGVPDEELATIRLLISRHLDLSSTMTSRDLEDAATARLLADRVGTVEVLKMLALMTYADISAVNPTAMTPWRADQLWRAYLLGYEELTRELDTERVRDFVDAGPETRDFVEGLPSRYLRTHAVEQIRSHAALAREAVEAGVALELTRHHGYWRAVVMATDRKFLFASMAGALASFGMNILKAEAFANARGLIVDTFTFADPIRTLELNPPEVDRLKDTLTRVILRKQDVRKMLASRRSQPAGSARGIEPRVVFNHDASQTATLIEIVAEDRPGLLYDLASTMSAAGCDIGVVLVDTEANRALDVFYVTAGGEKLSAPLERALRLELLAACSGTRA